MWSSIIRYDELEPDDDEDSEDSERRCREDAMVNGRQASSLGYWKVNVIWVLDPA